MKKYIVILLAFLVVLFLTLTGFICAWFFAKTMDPVYGLWTLILWCLIVILLAFLGDVVKKYADQLSGRWSSLFDTDYDVQIKMEKGADNVKEK